MKRGQMGGADKHAIRRKIEEKQVMVREQRKVRERLSRECADTMFHIASTKSTIKSMTAQHEETLKNQAEDFMYSTAADRREAHQLEEKCAELQRVIASSDIVERAQTVIAARLAALRLDDEKEEAENAREMDALKRNLFNARNDLENVFRTTLHDLNVAYQEQAFDDMVEEATTSREELPALRRDLCAKTKHANRVVAEQCGSFAGEGYAKIERDLTDGFVKLQAQRGQKLRRALQGQKLAIEREMEEAKALGDDLERFQAEAVELKAAAAELRQLRAASARAQEKYLHERAWAHTLAAKGPRALKTELKRRRLASLTAAMIASFKADRTKAGLGPAAAAESADSFSSEGGSGLREEGANSSGGDSDRTSIENDQEGDLRREGGKDDEEEDEDYDAEEERESRIGIESDTDSGSSSGGGDGEGDGRKHGRKFRHREGQPPFRARIGAPPPAERRDTLTLVAGMEVGGLGAETETSADKRPKARMAKKVEDPAARQRACDASERVWRASLNGSTRGRAHRLDIASNNVSGGGGGGGNNRGGSASFGDTATLSGAAVNRQLQQEQRLAAPLWPKGAFNTDYSLPPQAEDTADDEATSAVGAGRRRAETVPAQPKATESPPPPSTGYVATAAAAFSPSATPLGKRPAEVLASMLLSEKELVGVEMSAAEVLDRTRQWEQQQQQQQVGQSLQPFPDLPYGFTDLGRRVNVEGKNQQHRGVTLTPNGASEETGPL